ncbi:tyrosine-type recombinase/integrase [Roseivivax sp. THAF30]|uniref:tyrosine-type recombinase/integrase n=1 Tax=Roseivivax sp. THAF30 TaxID=2587852 RepID=UPI001267E071|nr:tyrosine-type recombinase/integrase [Roseivivax sp. THAF30]
MPKGIHRVRRKLVSGKSRFHFYAWRGGPKFWVDDVHSPRDPDFQLAFAEAIKRPEPKILMTPRLVDEFLSSAARAKAKRSFADQRKWLLRFAEHFHDAPVAIFEERGARGEVNKWRARWKHSPKQHDMAGTHAVRVLNWAVEEGHLSEHHCHRLPKLYDVDRSEVVWTTKDRESIDAIAPSWVQRLLCVACETGLRPGDLVKLTRAAVETTPSGLRLRVRTSKRGRVAHIPITETLARVIDATPRDQMLILTNARGNQLTPHRASEGLRQWRDKAGLSEDLRLQDCRGTAATRLLDAGLSLSEIASHMGWSLRHAANVIEHYARVSPGETDAVLLKLQQHKGAGS